MISWLKWDPNTFMGGSMGPKEALTPRIAEETSLWGLHGGKEEKTKEIEEWS